MMYDLLKAVHVAALFGWIGGMLMVGVVLMATAERSTLATVRQWDRRVTTPAMLLALAVGLSLLVVGGWTRQGMPTWLMLKLLLVVGLTAAHGILSGGLIRSALGAAVASRASRWSALLLLPSALAICLLVFLKPS